MTSTTVNDEFELDALLDGDEEEQTPKARASRKSKGPAKESRKMYTIEIDEVEGAQNFEVVGVNGVFHQLMRGVPIKVGEEVLEVLRNAVGTRWVKVVREDGREDLVPRKYSTIPWRLVG